MRTASTIERVIERTFGSVSRDARISEIRRKMATLAAPALMVLDEDGTLAGVLSKSDLLKPSQTRLVLVDHNEMTQAVSGAEEVPIIEIIDHHRLGPVNTRPPSSSSTSPWARPARSSRTFSAPRASSPRPRSPAS